MEKGGKTQKGRAGRACGSTENDWPLFPPSGLNYYHPGEHCLLWRRIILLSLGRPASNAPPEGATGVRDAPRGVVLAESSVAAGVGGGGADAEERPCSLHGSAIY